MRIKNNFTKGITQSDIAWRYLPNGTMVDAENFFVTITGGADVGLGKNPTGNVLVAANNFLGGKSWGAGKSSSNNKVYYFVKSTNYDYLMEYDSVTNLNVRVLQSTTGGALNLIERITNIDIFIDPEGNGNLIAWSGDSNPLRIGNIERMKTWGINGFTAEEIMLIKAPPVYSPTLLPIISNENTQANYLEDKFLCFGTRYKYNDGYYSCISSWSKYFFIPKIFDIDFETFENIGMVNSYNAIQIGFQTGTREVVAVQLVFKLSNTSDIYEVDTFIKKDKGWSETISETKTIEFNNSKSYRQLPATEYFRSFDNIPEKALAQTVIGNRLAFGNITEGFDLIDKNNDKVKMQYTVNLVTNNITDKTATITNANITYPNTEFPIVAPSYTVVAGQMSIDLTGVNLIVGSSIVVDFKLKGINITRAVPLSFNAQFPFTLVSNYTSVADLVTNSLLLQQLVSFTTRFEANGGTSYPLSALVPFTRLKPFSASASGNNLVITFPVIKYEINNSPSANTFLYEYFYNVSSVAKFNKIAVTTSMKSNRDYQIAQIYRDLQGRKTTALISEKNTIYIPNANAITQNQINVNIPITQKPPKKAHTYKFAIKRNKGDYEIIPINVFFIDGLYRWLKIDGENTNKLKKGDTLIIKRDGTGFLPTPIRVKVLDFGAKVENFLTNNAASIVEPQGNYAKIKALNFQMEYAVNEFYESGAFAETTNGRPIAYVGDFSEIKNGVAVDRIFKQGSVATLRFVSTYAGDQDTSIYFKRYTAGRDYANFGEWFNEAILPDGFTTDVGDVQSVSLVRGIPVYGLPLAPTLITSINTSPPNNTTGRLWLIVQGTESGTGSGTFDNAQYGRVNALVNIRSVQNIYVFENEAVEIINDTYYETPEIYRVIDGEHQQVNHLLTETYNCFCQGNGIESFQIRDAFNTKKLAIDFSPTAVSEDEYKQITKNCDISYSGIYNPNTNVNGLNEFNLSTANFKDDIEKSFGSIIKLRGKDTNLEVYQEDRISMVLYGKNLLTTADGQSQVTQTQEVLNQQNTYGGENGISTHSSSFDFESFNEYFSDIKRGAVCKKSNNGVFEISNQGQKNYFRKLFRDNKINNIIGAYDLFHDYYYLNIKYNDTQYVTWIYSDSDNGWLGRIKFNPEDMIRINNDFISFQNGNVYKHNQEKNGLLDNYNTFYGTQFPSQFSFVVNDEPSMQKMHKAMSMESTDAWDIILETNLNNGFINKADFEKQEGVYYAHIRNQNLTIDTALIGANSGIGNCTVSGLNLQFAFNLEDSISIGDEIRNSNLQLVGIVLNKTINSLSLNTVSNIVSGDFVLCSKPQSIESNILVGHSMLVTCTINTNKKTEVFAIGTEVEVSSPT